MIADTSTYVHSFNGYVYGDNVAELREELATKLSLTNSAGRNGKRIGENYQDIKRLIVGGSLDELDTGGPNEVPLRVVVQRFRYAHRAEVGKQKLYLHSAADGRPAEFVYAAVENVTGLKWEAPITTTDFEISFVAEPEVYYDELITANLRQGGATVGNFRNYAASVLYVGPDTDFFADVEGLPSISLVVSSINAEHDISDPDTTDPAYIEIANSTTGQVFRIYPNATGTYILDSYEEGIRFGATFVGGVVYELADYDQFIFLSGAATGGGVNNALTISCYYCDISAATLSVYPRHW